MKIAVAADLHFERGGDAGVTQYQKTYGEMCAGIIQRAVDAVVFAGDIFNRWHSFNPRTFRVVSDGIEQLITQGIRVFIMAGNHDYDISGTFPAIVPFEKLGAEIVTRPNSKVISIASTEKMGPFFNDTNESVLFTFLPWITKGMAKSAGIDLKQTTETINENIYSEFVEKELVSARATKSKLNVKNSYLFFHASIFGADMGSMRCIESVDFTLYPDRLKEYEYDLIVGGHFHRRQEHNGVIYVGSMERQNFGERDNKTGWMLIDGKRHEFIELKSPARFMEYSWDFTDPEHPYEQFLRYMNAVVASNAPDNANVKFKYKIRRNDPFDRAAILKQFYEAGALSVVMEPEYLDEVQARTDIKAEQDFMTQFSLWLEANPNKDPDGEMLALLERERMAGFPVDTTKEHIGEMLNGGNS